MIKTNDVFKLIPKGLDVHTADKLVLGTLSQFILRF